MTARVSRSCDGCGREDLPITPTMLFAAVAHCNRANRPCLDTQVVRTPEGIKYLHDMIWTNEGWWDL